MSEQRFVLLYTTGNTVNKGHCRLHKLINAQTSDNIWETVRDRDSFNGRLIGLNSAIFAKTMNDLERSFQLPVTSSKPKSQKNASYRPIAYETSYGTTLA